MKKLLLILSFFISSVSFCLAQNSRIIDRGQYLELILGDSAKIVSAAQPRVIITFKAY